jgi:hypothetical protein
MSPGLALLALAASADETAPKRPDYSIGFMRRAKPF